MPWHNIFVFVCCFLSHFVNNIPDLNDKTFFGINRLTVFDKIDRFIRVNNFSNHSLTRSSFKMGEYNNSITMA